jgi:adenylyltransferase/sulfurtransferase
MVQQSMQGDDMLSEQELKRYNRQMLIEGWGEVTQKKLKKATVFIAGAGGLGSPVSIYLAVAGVGNIRICDFDSPDWSNLNRQILHNHNRIGTNKAVSAAQTLTELNPDIAVIAITDKITTENVDELVDDADLILDCMDNFPTRFLLNECAIRKSIPLVYGSIWGMEGRLSFLQPPETPCLQCIFPEAPPQEVFPVLGATPGVIGSLQALEAIKYLSGAGKNLKGKLMVWDGVNTEFRNLKAYRDPECPACKGLQK